MLIWNVSKDRKVIRSKLASLNIEVSLILAKMYDFLQSLNLLSIEMLSSSRRIDLPHGIH